MSVLGDRWSLLVLITVHDHVEIRTADLLRSLDGISQKVLTQSLRGLERLGLLDRSVEATVPVSVSYRLTDLGVDLYAAVVVLREWAQRHDREMFG